MNRLRDLMLVASATLFLGSIAFSVYYNVVFVEVVFSVMTLGIEGP